jgi:hypothetical protein
MGGRESWSEWPLSGCGCRAIRCTSATAADDALDRWQAWAQVGEAELAWEGHMARVRVVGRSAPGQRRLSRRVHSVEH